MMMNLGIVTRSMGRFQESLNYAGKAWSCMKSLEMFRGSAEALSE